MPGRRSLSAVTVFVFLGDGEEEEVGAEADVEFGEAFGALGPSWV